jgi:hypothetical protein
MIHTAELYVIQYVSLPNVTSCAEPKNAICDVKCEKPECDIKCPDKRL